MYCQLLVKHRLALSNNFLQMSYFLAAVTSGVDFPTFIRAMAFFAAAPVAGFHGFCLFFLTVLDAVDLDWVLLCSA